MGTVADVNYGFKGQVSSAQTPLVLGTGARYAVIGSGLKAEAGGAGDRSVTVSAGTAWGDGVLSTWNTSGVVNAAANSTGQTRWDTLVIRRHWQPASSPTGTATLMLLTGGAAKTIAVSRKTDRGVTDSDQPIALVPIAPGSAVAGAPVGIRCWSGAGGGLVAENVEALQYLTDLGTTVRVGSERHTYMLDSTGTANWQVDDTRVAVGPRPFVQIGRSTAMSGVVVTSGSPLFGGIAAPSAGNAASTQGDWGSYFIPSLGAGAASGAESNPAKITTKVAGVYRMRLVVGVQVDTSTIFDLILEHPGAGWSPRFRGYVLSGHENIVTLVDEAYLPANGEVKPVWGALQPFQPKRWALSLTRISD